MIMQRAPRLCVRALVIGWYCLSTTVVAAQSLALDYGLNLNVPALPAISVTNDPCDVIRLSLPKRCRGEVADQFVSNIRLNGVSSNVPPANFVDYAAPVVRQPRAYGFADDAAISSTSGDVTLRIGSKYRLRYNADNSEPHRFFDARYEAWAQRNELNSVGVELLFPFH
jgi:hypothetical protein